MKKIALVFFILWVNISIYAITPAWTTWPKKDTVEFQPRNGLPNFFNKIKNGEVTKIGFFGEA